MDRWVRETDVLAGHHKGPDVAARAGHSVDVLLKVYAKCVDGQEATVNQRIQAALGGLGE